MLSSKRVGWSTDLYFFQDPLMSECLSSPYRASRYIAAIGESGILGFIEHLYSRAVIQLLSQSFITASSCEWNWIHAPKQWAK